MTDSIWQRVEAAKYDVDDATAKEYLAIGAGASQLSNKIHGGYFKLLAVRAKKEGDIEKAHKSLYEIVKQTHVHAGMSATERNAVTNFARTAYSTLKQLPVTEIQPDQSKAWHRKRIKANNSVSGTSFNATWVGLWNEWVIQGHALMSHSKADLDAIKRGLLALNKRIQ